MAALKLVLSLWFLVGGLFLVSPVFAAELPQPRPESATCYYSESCEINKESGTRLCWGEGQQGSCTYSDTVGPRCSPCALNSSTTPSPSPFIPPRADTSPGCTPEPGKACEVNQSNYKAPQNANYTIQNLGHAAFCELLNGSPLADCLGTQQTNEGGKIKNKLIVYKNSGVSGGAIGGITTLVASLYNPPASSVQYLAHIGENLGLIKPVYAQVPGSGAGVVAPILKLWQAIRNFTYLIFIVIFLITGFMIMLRQKINPQTVITIQNALPGLVVGLILVTFSYFIASLIIDLAFVGIPLIAHIFSQTGLDNAFGSASDIQNIARESNLLQMFWTTLERIGSPETFSDLFSGISNTASLNSPAYLAYGLITGIIGAIIGTLVFPGLGTLGGIALGGGLGGALGPLIVTGVVSIIIPLVLVIALTIQMFRLFLGLIGAYIQLLISTLTGPLIILASSLPGRGGGINDWIKNLLANALIFPAVIAGFLFAGMILALRPEDWQSTPPLFGGLSTELVRVILAYGVLLSLPAIPDTVRGAFGIKQQGGLGQAALAGFIAGWTSVGTGYGRATGGVKAAQEAQAKLNAENTARNWSAATQPGGLRGIWNRVAQRLPT